MSQIYKLPLVLEPQPEGETVQEALQNANDALAAIVEALKELKRPLPSALQPAHDNTTLWVETVLAV